ncbi:MAG: methylmalonyl-CoA epimerase [Candidatus Kapaibacterium sp.]
MKLEHLGIAVKSLETSVPLFEKIFGVKAGEMEYVAEQKVKVIKIKLENFDIELLEATSEDSPIGKFVEKRGEGIHHCSFNVPDVAGKLEELKQNGIQLIDQQPRIGAEGMLIAFLHPKSTNGILMELAQHKQ